MDICSRATSARGGPLPCLLVRRAAVLRRKVPEGGLGRGPRTRLAPPDHTGRTGSDGFGDYEQEHAKRKRYPVGAAEATRLMLREEGEGSHSSPGTPRPPTGGDAACKCRRDAEVAH